MYKMYKKHVEQFQFYKLPQWLFQEPYKKLSSNAKVMYSLMFNRLSLSVKNGWYDEQERLYIYFTLDDFEELLQVSRPTVIKIKKELMDVGLLEEVRQGLNKPNILYVNGSKETLPQEEKELNDGSKEIYPTEVKEVYSTKTNITKTNRERLIEEEQEQASSVDNIYKKRAEQWAEPAPAVKELFDYYQSAFGRPIPSQHIEELYKYLYEDEMPPEVIRCAIDKALVQGVLKHKYVEGILRGWRANGIKTLAQIKAEDKAFEERKAKQQGRVTKGKSLKDEVGF